MVVQGGFVDSAGVVVEAARDRKVQREMRFRHTERLDQAEHLLQLRPALFERRAACAKRVEFRQGIDERGRAERDEIDEFVHDVRGKTKGVTGQRCTHRIRAAFVELVHLAQHGSLTLSVGESQPFEPAAHQFAIVDLDRERAKVEVAEHVVDDRRQFGVVAYRQTVLADHVDVALVELAKPSTLRAFAPIHTLDLVTAEWKREIAFVLSHVARERHGQVEAQREFGLLALLHRTGRLHEIDLAFRFAAFLGQQHAREFHHRCFDRQETETLEIAPDRVEHRLKRNLVERQQFEHAGHRAGLGDGHRFPSDQRRANAHTMGGMVAE